MMNTLMLRRSVNEIDKILMEAQSKEISYVEMLRTLFTREINLRQEDRLQKNLKQACFRNIKPWKCSTYPSNRH